MAAKVLNLGGCALPVHALFEMYLDTADGHMLTLYQTRSARTLGSWVYDGATSLAKYLETDHFSTQFCSDNGGLAGKQLLELGAGTGIVGLMAAHLGAHVTITDLPPLVPLIDFNIQANKAALRGKAEARELCWGDPLDGFEIQPDYIILANCVYYETYLELLVQTVLEFSGPQTVVLASYEVRTKEIKALIQRFHDLMSEHFFLDDISEEYFKEFCDQDFVRIVSMRKK